LGLGFSGLEDEPPKLKDCLALEKMSLAFETLLVRRFFSLVALVGVFNSVFVSFSTGVSTEGASFFGGGMVTGSSFVGDNWSWTSGEDSSPGFEDPNTRFRRAPVPEKLLLLLPASLRDEEGFWGKEKHYSKNKVSN
jgi:hypothetical protein